MSDKNTGDDNALPTGRFAYLADSLAKLEEGKDIPADLKQGKDTTPEPKSKSFAETFMDSEDPDVLEVLKEYGIAKGEGEDLQIDPKLKTDEEKAREEERVKLENTDFSKKEKELSEMEVKYKAELDRLAKKEQELLEIESVNLKLKKDFDSREAEIKELKDFEKFKTEKRAELVEMSTKIRELSETGRTKEADELNVDFQFKVAEFNRLDLKAKYEKDVEAKYEQLQKTEADKRQKEFEADFKKAHSNVLKKYEADFKANEEFEDMFVAKFAKVRDSGEFKTPGEQFEEAIRLTKKGLKMGEFAPQNEDKSRIDESTRIEAEKKEAAKKANESGKGGSTPKSTPAKPKTQREMWVELQSKRLSNTNFGFKGF